MTYLDLNVWTDKNFCTFLLAFYVLIHTVPATDSLTDTVFRSTE